MRESLALLRRLFLIIVGYYYDRALAMILRVYACYAIYGLPLAKLLVIGCYYWRRQAAITHGWLLVIGAIAGCAATWLVVAVI